MKYQDFSSPSPPPPRQLNPSPKSGYYAYACELNLQM